MKRRVLFYVSHLLILPIALGGICLGMFSHVSSVYAMESDDHKTHTITSQVHDIISVDEKDQTPGESCCSDHRVDQKQQITQAVVSSINDIPVLSIFPAHDFPLIDHSSTLSFIAKQHFDSPRSQTGAAIKRE